MDKIVYAEPTNARNAPLIQLELAVGNLAAVKCQLHLVPHHQARVQVQQDLLGIPLDLVVRVQQGLTDILLGLVVKVTLSLLGILLGLAVKALGGWKVPLVELYLQALHHHLHLFGTLLRLLCIVNLVMGVRKTVTKILGPPGKRYIHLPANLVHLDILAKAG